MKKIKIGSLKDGAKFKISDRKEGKTYKLHSKTKGEAVYSSITSKRTFRCKLSREVYEITAKSC